MSDKPTTIPTENDIREMAAPRWETAAWLVTDAALLHAASAFSRMIELMQSKDDAVALQAAKEVLDRALGQPHAINRDYMKIVYPQRSARQGERTMPMPRGAQKNSVAH